MAKNSDRTIKIEGDPNNELIKGHDKQTRERAEKVLKEANSFVLVSVKENGDVASVSLVRDARDIIKLGVTCDEIQEKFREEFISFIAHILDPKKDGDKSCSE